MDHKGETIIRIEITICFNYNIKLKSLAELNTTNIYLYMYIFPILCFDNSMKNEPSAHNRKMLVHDAMPRRVQFMAPSRVYAFSSWSQWWQKPNDPSKRSTLHIFLQSQLIGANINENKKKTVYNVRKIQSHNSKEKEIDLRKKQCVATKSISWKQ